MGNSAYWIALFLIFGVSQRSWCGFFDYTDFDDPFQMLWNAKNQVVRESNTPCLGNVSNIQMEGVCKSLTECQLTGGASSTGGISVGSCGLLSTCCVYMGSCGKRLSAKISYFRSNGVSTPQSCTFQVKLHNRNICQLRLDFVELTLAPPAQTDPNLGTCRDEKFFVEGHPNIPQFCGKNTGQHMYVPVNGNDTTPVTLHLELLGNPLTNSGWTIKITQLSCPGTSIFPYRTQITAMARDFPLLAPQGCLQYFTDLKGSFRSFGFDMINPTASTYNVNQTYAICFKRQSSVCGIRFISDYFQVGRIPDPTDDDDSPTDYLYIPSMQRSTPPSDGRISGQQARDNYYIVDTPGPLYVYFSSDSNADGALDSGFNLRYELATACA